MSQNTSKASYYYYPDTAYGTFDYSEFNKYKNQPQKFIKAFNQIDLSECSKDLKQYLLKKLKQKRKYYIDLIKSVENHRYMADIFSLTLLQLFAEVKHLIDTDIDHINAKKRGMSRLADYYNRMSKTYEKLEKYYDEWAKTLTQAIRKLGGD